MISGASFERFFACAAYDQVIANSNDASFSSTGSEAFQEIVGSPPRWPIAPSLAATASAVKTNSKAHRRRCRTNFVDRSALRFCAVKAIVVIVRNDIDVAVSNNHDRALARLGDTRLCDAVNDCSNQRGFNDRRVITPLKMRAIKRIKLPAGPLELFWRPRIGLQPDNIKCPTRKMNRRLSKAAGTLWSQHLLLSMR